MPSEKVGSLFVEVGVHGEKAIAEARLLHETLKKISRDIAVLGKSANFNAVTSKLKAVNVQAIATQKSLAAVSTTTKAPATDLVKQQEAQYAGLLKAREADNKAMMASIASQAVARQRLSALTMADLSKEVKATARAATAEVAIAHKSADEQIRAADKLLRSVQANAVAEVKTAAASAAAQAKIDDKLTLRKIRNDRLAAASRRGALKRGSGDIATGLAAAGTGNVNYAAASIFQGLTKMSGAMEKANIASLAVKAGFLGIVGAGVAVEVAIAAVTAKVALFGIQTAASFETLQIQLEGLLGSARAGKEELDFLLNLGQTSIVPTESLIAASRQLAAFGVENTKQRRDLIQFISDFGTATSATEQQIYFLSLAVGQVAARGKADMVDLKQLGNAGVKTLDIYKAVGKEIGKPWQEVRDGVKDGIITSDLLISALASLGDKYAETAKKAMKSTNGLIANIKDIVTVGMGRAFESLNKQVGAVLQQIQEALTQVDFTFIARAVQNAVNNIKAALGDVPSAGDATVTFFEETLPNAIAFVGRDIAALVKNIRVMGLAIQVAGLAVEVAMHAISASVVTVALAAYDATNAMTLGLGGLVDSATLKIRDTLVSAQQDAAASGNAALDAMLLKNAELDALWKIPVNKPLTYTISYANSGYAPGGSIYNSQLGPYVLNAMKPKVPKEDPLDLGGTKTSGDGGGPKVDPMIQIMKDRIAALKELTEQALKGRDALRDAFLVPFAAKQPGAKSDAFKAFSSGEIDTIVSQYKTIKQALVDYYTLAEKRGGAAAKKIAKQRKSDIAFLKSQTGELVALAVQAEKINKRLEEADKAYEKVTEAIDAQRKAVAAQNDAQAAKIRAQYDGYFTAISKTEGTFTEGSIAIAERALDAATTAYEAAQDKLDDLKAARDDFLESMREMAISFVNDLAQVTTEITKFTRLDAVGSFSEVTTEITDTRGFVQGLKDRLQALKDFAANVRTLIGQGLDQSLVQMILEGGPKENGALAADLAGASSAEIADINAVQADLAATIASMQSEASAQWFDAGIAAQEAFTAPLKAAMDAAQLQVDTLNRQKDLAIGVLEAWNVEQSELLDAQEAYQKKLYDERVRELEEMLRLNKVHTEQTALQIDERLVGLTTTAYASGLASGLGTIQGLIDGLKDDAKLTELKAAAAHVARLIKNTINSVLEVRSPSRVMVETGRYVGEGLALGIGLSEPLVTDASQSLANAAVSGMLPSTPGSGGTMVKVFIGERELTDIVSTEVTTIDARSLDYVTAGRRF